jgi:hypothetical protein
MWEGFGDNTALYSKIHHLELTLRKEGGATQYRYESRNSTIGRVEGETVCFFNEGNGALIASSSRVSAKV